MLIKVIQNKSKRIQEVEKALGEPIEEYLRRRFVDDGVHLHDLKDELGIAYPTLIKLLKLAGVYGRRLGL